MRNSELRKAIVSRGALAAEASSNLFRRKTRPNDRHAAVPCRQSRSAPLTPSDAAENLSGSRTKSAEEILAAKNAKIAKKFLKLRELCALEREVLQSFAPLHEHGSARFAGILPALAPRRRTPTSFSPVHGAPRRRTKSSRLAKNLRRSRKPHWIASESSPFFPFSLFRGCKLFLSGYNIYIRKNKIIE